MNLIKTYKRPYKDNQIKRVEMFCKQNNLVFTNLQIFEGYVTFDGYSNTSYEDLAKKLIREQYSLEDEYKLHREAIMNGINDEFLTYNAYVEGCKTIAKDFISQREKAIGSGS